MKKSLVALAALAFVGVASAQSSVTLFGVLDAGVTHFNSSGGSVTKFDTSGLSSSQLGFRGTEDLGGGMSANFWLEAALVNGSGMGSGSGNGATGGGLAFGRRSTVSLAGNFGEVRLGREYTPSFWNQTVFDPFGTLGVGAGSNLTCLGAGGAAGKYDCARANNSISYLWGFAPNGTSAVGSGLYAQLMYALPGNTSNTPSIGQYTGGRIGYANGPLNVALSYAQSHGTPYAPDAAAGYSTYKETDLAGSYNIGVANLMAHYTQNNSDVDGTKFTNWGLGATINAGPGYIPISYNRANVNDATGDSANQYAIGYVYNLSKRTALYAAVSHISNNNNANVNFAGGNGGGASPVSMAAGGSGTGYQVGMKTSF
ncbi:MAG: porin [Rhodoferax sp.]|nr:porin [Rhodoferax sp.]